jgi:BirA family biotin operon repressor/biotin-[acetyl-CoA-carboxylase] ligase
VVFFRLQFVHDESMDLNPIIAALQTIQTEGSLAVAAWPSQDIGPEKLGLAVDGDRIQWDRAPDRLDPVRLQAELPDLSNTIFEVIGSTNTALLERAQSEFIANKLYLAEFQYAGRGRRGRDWLSPYARNLSMSLAHQTRHPLNQLGGLSSIVGLGLCDALLEMGLEGVQIKWPNDIHVSGQKLCGILIELHQAPDGVAAVIGMGVNVSLSDEEIAMIGQPATDLRRQGVKESRTELVINLIRRVREFLSRFEQNGFADFVDAFNALHRFHGEHCVITQGDQHIDGLVAGIDTDGSLLLDTASGRRSFHGGEVSLRSR